MVRIRYSFGSRHTGHIENIKKQRKEFPVIVEEVVRISDIILEILDCRFIDKTRNFMLEKLVRKMKKKIIFILNKSDLVDFREVEKNLKRNMKPYVFVSSKTGFGAKALRDRIKIEAKRVGSEKQKKVQIGIVGYPNTGKSSLINLITRKGSTRISKQAGFTKGIQKIRLTEDILLLDTPGVIPEKEYSTLKEKILRNALVGARTFSDVKNPEDVVFYLTKDNSKVIEKFYGVESSGDFEVLIEKVGRKKNFLKKGGEVDSDRTARAILKDWQEGKINSV
jgi:hypothetical protein